MGGDRGRLGPSEAAQWYEPMKQPLVSRSLDVMGGTAVFLGTRVPVQTLLDCLEAGESIDDFLEGFPSVTRAQVIAFLEEAKDRVIAIARISRPISVAKSGNGSATARAADRSIRATTPR